MSDFIMQMRPWFGEEESSAITEYMATEPFLTEFKKTEEFENLIGQYTGSKHCIVVNNGTISMTLAALALGLSAGDEIIVPNYTMVATANAFKMVGLTPVFVDVSFDTLCLNLELARAAITKNTKAIVLMTANGRYPSEGIKAFEQLAAEENIFLIEDAAQSLGSCYPDGRHIGTASSIGSFSFSAPKVISTGQGGALVTNDDDLAYKLRRLKDFGRSGGGNDVHDSIGFNFKFTDLQAVIGIEQMKKLSWRVNRKKEILKKYQELLSHVEEVKFFKQDLEITTPWFIDILAEDRDNLIQALKQKRIGSRVMYPPLNEQKCYSINGAHPISQLIGSKGLWLPSEAQLEDHQIEGICSMIIGFYNT